MNIDEGAKPPERVERILHAPQVARAIENDRYKTLLDNVPVAVAVSRGAVDEQYIVYANAMFETLIGAGAAEVEGRPWSCLDGFHSDDEPTRTLGEAIAAGEDFLGVFRSPPGSYRAVVQAYAAAIESDNGPDSFRIVALVDIGGRERAQLERYESQIRERDMLLRELQHRVKNNLQLITALIRLEARAASEGEAVALGRLAGRIDALTVLYRTLSAEEVAAEIDLGRYLTEIAQAVMAAQAAADITLDIQADPVELPVDIAMPVGLLVNEMLTNALKYAFQGRSRGLLRIACKRDGDRVTIMVSDDGVGMPEGTVWPSPRKLGALVLQTLRENARNVTLDVASLPGRGTVITVGFSRAAAKAPQ